MAGIVILVVFTVLALVPTLLVGPLQTALTATGPRLAPPSLDYPLGTDELGRSILNLTVHATRVSMVIGFLATIVTVLIGAVLGIMSGFIGGKFDAVSMRIADFFLVIPTFVLAIILTAIIRDVLGTGSTEILGIRLSLITIVIVIGITSWSSTSRIIRSQTLSLKERAFVDRARVVGAGGGHIMRRHVLPNVTNLIVANAVLDVRGRDPDRDDALVRRSRRSVPAVVGPDAWTRPARSAPRVSVPGGTSSRPASASCLVVFAFTLLGSALDAVLNPKLQARR